MKIYVIRVPPHLRPESQPFDYPKHSADYGVEQDFHEYLVKNCHLTIPDPQEADWHYLPVYWTRWHLSHNYGREGLFKLQEDTSRLILNDAKTFTICQYDDGPLIDLGKATIFLAARKTAFGIDIPVLCSPHRTRFLFKPRKKYLASFVGRLSSHPIRQQMAACLKKYKNVYIYDGDRSTRFFVKKMLESYMALCPRGYGGSSFRFFEAMQLGITPFFIGEPDTRPFRNFIKWNECSYYSPSADEVPTMLDICSCKELEILGKRAQDVYAEDLAYGKWCRFVIEELKART